MLLATGAALAASLAPPPTVEDMAREAVAACVAPGTADNRAVDVAERTRLIGCSIRVVAAELNRAAPVQVDEITTLTSVSAEGMRLTYRYDVSRDRAQMDVAAMVSIVTAAACFDPYMVQTMSFGGSYEYIWRDRRGLPIHRMLIERCDTPAPEPTPASPQPDA